MRIANVRLLTVRFNRSYPATTLPRIPLVTIYEFLAERTTDDIASRARADLGSSAIIIFTVA